ncbi:hypothetical protein [Crocosphaera watsonii]|uniref:Uncharacterized protein n=2 Tax=Crocosphaera watsonii TaxID=263511 RepID=G5JCL7_CROWT|nr:hypothetical protein [Crocosphaera watsonii]EHJ10069.1 hypothetical protein CWATWH0003_5171 [Crocosphaera watsonii WH 0003]CCQ57974.1 hypothetical protein CWATWH0005_3787 [Crocosphaera watsonii WH 0005]
MAVPENYKTVTCYLPPEIAEQLKAYCFEHEITRNNKRGQLSPSWGTGIVEALKLFFSSDNLPSPLPDNVLEKKMVEQLVKDSFDSLLPGILPDTIPSEEKLKELIEESVTNLLPSLLSSHVLTTDSPIVKELNSRLSQLEGSRNEPYSKYNHEVIPSSTDDVGEITEQIFETGETKRFTDKEVQIILKQKYNIRTTPQTLSKWRLKETQPRGRNRIIFDLFKPDGDLWQPL